MTTHLIREIKLWVRENDAKDTRRLITTITPTSKFKTMPWFNRLKYCTDADLVKAAKDQRDGWKFNGPWPNAVFEIEAIGYKNEEISI